MMKIVFIFILISFNNAFGLVVTGKAFRDNKLIYTEKHFPTSLSDGSYSTLKTEYIDDRGKLFSEISSDFSMDPFVPNVFFKDNRFNLIENISKDKGGNKLKIERDDKKNRKVSYLETKPTSILGQGFHNYIIKNFDNILKDEVDVHFIISSKSDQYHFKMYLAKKSENEVIIRGKIDNFFLRAFVKEIELTYAVPSKRLLKFKGLSNLDDDQGNSQNVEILYEYTN